MLFGPIFKAPVASASMIEPPPAPMAETATVGTRIGKSATRSWALSTGRPRRTTPMSALVPPTSKVMRSAVGQPASAAAAAAPATPAAGPDSSEVTGRSAMVASSSIPPFEREPRAGVRTPRSAMPLTNSAT